MRSQAQKRIPNKSELLRWLNDTLKDNGEHYSRVEQLGTGVGFLLLLSLLHPQIFRGVKLNSNPVNQYEYQLNFKMLANALSKLAVTKCIDIDKLTKMNMQENFGLLQWFYEYARELNNPQPPQQQKKKITVKSGHQMHFQPPKDQIKNKNGNKKQQAQIDGVCDKKLHTISSAVKKIAKIEQVLTNCQISSNQVKLDTIISILGLNASKLIPSKSTLHIDQNIHSENKPQRIYMTKCEKNRKRNSHSEQRQRRHGKSLRLQEKYSQYMKNLLSRPKQSQNPLPKATHALNQSRINQLQKSRRPSIRGVKLHIGQEDGTYQRLYSKKQLRFTDNSMLLHSECKSVQSDTNLLQD